MSDQRLISQLETQFPWLLEDDADVSGADVVESLADWHETLKKESSDAPKGERKHARFGDFIKLAREMYAVEGECEIDEDAAVSISEDESGDGESWAYVQAWVYVGGEHFCRTCHEPYTAGGDGFNGECPSCADKTAAKDDDGEAEAADQKLHILRDEGESTNGS